MVVHPYQHPEIQSRPLLLSRATIAFAQTSRNPSAQHHLSALRTLYDGKSDTARKKVTLRIVGERSSDR